MKAIKLGNREVTIVGSPMTPFFYKQAFGQSLSGDVVAMQNIEKDLSSFDDINLLQMIWAMEKTAKTGRVEPFEQWLGSFEYLNLMDIAGDVIDEVMRATFRSPQDQEKQE